MQIWLVTTGSSDVQLKTDECWDDWYRLIKQDCYRLPFVPTQAVRDSEDPYRITPRVLGMAYQACPDEIWNALKFPLLEGFTARLKGEEIAQIILLLTDQSQIFDDTHRDDLKCPYWQDTCELQLVFERYFKTHFPNADLVPLIIAPQQGESGLDDWNFALKLVRSKLRAGISGEPTTVYVSHQAGTPAISSAVQFSSLARFRNDVQFLVSNEYQSEQTRTIPRSTYLRGIQIQEARALLDRCDYAGVERLLGSHLIKPKNSQHKRIQILLKAAIEWNHAEFHKFRNILTKGGVMPKDAFPWWRLGYESAYLAVVRLQQGSTVEALFHSFRAVEGSIIQWAKSTYNDHIDLHPKYGLQLKDSVCSELPGYFNALSEASQNSFRKWKNIGLFGVPLYELLKQAKPHWQTDADIAIVWDSAKDKRNTTFHNIEGLQEQEVYGAWGTQTSAEWQARVLGCLNFISGESFKAFELNQPNSKLASLIVEVHKELEGEIDNL